MTLPNEGSSKAEWRTWAKTVRARLDTPQLSQQIVQVIRDWQPYHEAKYVLIYLAFGSEIDLSALHEDRGKTFYVTRTWDKGRDLTVHKLDLAELETHRYGYLQPSSLAEVVSPEIIDLAFVPGLCFDKQGNRIGYGAGYYDRLLPLLKPAAVKAAVSSSAQIVDALPVDSFDIPVDVMIFGKGILYVA